MDPKDLAIAVIEILDSQNKRYLLSSVIEELNNANSSEGIITVISATTLDSAQCQKIEAKLKSKNPQLSSIFYKIDKSILGGLIIRYGNTEQDMSLRKKVAEINKALEQI